MSLSSRVPCILRASSAALVAACSSSLGALALAEEEEEEEEGLRRGRAARAARRPGAAPRGGGERVYSSEEVASADGADGRPMWVTYRGGVYDITAFHAVHPGGALIVQAAGGDVQPFWDVWAYHHEAPKVGEFLEKLRIGALEGAAAAETGVTGDTGETGETAAAAAAMMGAGPPEDDPYLAEPVRDGARQTIFTERPYCSETPNAVLGSSYLTPAEALYVLLLGEEDGGDDVEAAIELLGDTR